MYTHRTWLEDRNLGFRKKRDCCTFYVAKTKALISYSCRYCTTDLWLFLHMQKTGCLMMWLKYYMSLVMRKPAFCICKNKDADQIGAFVFATRIVQSLYFLNPKFQGSSHLLWLYSLVCVGPGLKPRRPVFSQRGSYVYVVCREANFPCVSV